jgi:hypothetical protein
MDTFIFLFRNFFFFFYLFFFINLIFFFFKFLFNHFVYFILIFILASLKPPKSRKSLEIQKVIKIS